MKILIVDNDESTSVTLKALLLSKEDFEIDTAYSGQGGLDKMAEKTYDIIILDIMMPYVSGMDVCRAMNQNSRLKNIPVLLMSSAVPISPDDFHESLKKMSELSVVKGVLEKPFVIDDLIAKIHKAVESDKA